MPLPVYDPSAGDLNVELDASSPSSDAIAVGTAKKEEATAGKYDSKVLKDSKDEDEDNRNDDDDDDFDVFGRCLARMNILFILHCFIFLFELS